MSKDITFGRSAMEKMLRGFDIAANAVSGTLGPRGLNVFLDDPISPKFTNDGASIATNVVLKDPLQDSGAKILKNTCGQTLDDAGDGTTTSAVLIQAIVHECLKRPESPMEIRESLLKASPKIVKSIQSRSTPIVKEDIKKVALISAENEDLAENISQIIKQIGEDAVITVEDSYEPTISYELVSGYEANVGFMDPRFADPKDKKARCVMQDVPVFVTDKKISATSDISPLWTKFASAGISSCVIVCDDIETPMLGVFLTSKLMGKFNALVIRATGELLKDIEAAVGATRVSDVTGVSFQNVGIEHLGKAKKVICDANKTVFISDDPSKSTLYATHLESFAKNEPNIYVKTRLERRVSQLRGGVAVLKIGTQDFNREYLKDKADDAIKASKSALQEGIVMGGGLCLWDIAQKMKPKSIGEEILKKALTAPFRKILENANKDYTEVVMEMSKYPTIGYDVKNDRFVDMIELGIIDPTKVTRSAIENSISNAANFITMSVAITEHVDDKK